MNCKVKTEDGESSSNNKNQQHDGVSEEPELREPITGTPQSKASKVEDKDST